MPTKENLSRRETNQGYMSSLSSCIVRSLKLGEMAQDLPEALLSRNRTQVLNRDETDYWDYKGKAVT
jgi:hypothetical protein